MVLCPPQAHTSLTCRGLSHVQVESAGMSVCTHAINTRYLEDNNTRMVQQRLVRGLKFRRCYCCCCCIRHVSNHRRAPPAHRPILFLRLEQGRVISYIRHVPGIQHFRHPILYTTPPLNSIPPGWSCSSSSRRRPELSPGVRCKPHPQG